MQKTVASFALATLSLLTSYAIVAAWPGQSADIQPIAIDMVPTVTHKPTVISLAD